MNRMQLQELLDDADNCTRLTAWETGFLESMRSKLDRTSGDPSLSDKQLDALKDLSNKVYTSG